MNQELEELDNNTLIKLIFESVHLVALHYGIWFRELEHQIGLDKTLEADDIVWKQVLPGLLERIGKRFGKSAGDIPGFLAGCTRGELAEIIGDLNRTWYVNDGIWFQTVEKNFDYEMHLAKRVNDSCWTRFSYIEAKRLMKTLDLPENGGIPVLRQALKYRQYSLLNRHEIVDVDENKIIFRVNECRVQEARSKKGLPEYPCRSAGYVEYARFAEGIDTRIRTACIDCPPDRHPAEWYCGWGFEI